ncbi:rhodanese-like domain-containing protein [Cellulomonas bogoriensis]|uniref:Sulfurtransferase n=1 Tax=Cellulomonas bogoriensis 69B4 = DSM 16987 TaxID=1386082 RepID=A0A0A0C2Y2_9CELL|nr:rhodanese-like domain-containing protein [Cellulomonas bogoriensis]KGM13699.1 sulfurtransferase [Cellulomonas bogoriensis 69B4 = DSM 16987]
MTRPPSRRRSGPGPVLALLTALTVVTTACTSTGGEAAPPVLVTSHTVGVEEFKDVISRPGTVVLDVRTPEEFDAAHLPGAVNVDVHDPTFVDQVTGLDPAGTYAVYCRSGNRSQQALDLMARAGLTDAVHLADGILAWESAGEPTTTDG